MTTVEVTSELRTRVVKEALASRPRFLQLTASQRERIVAMAERNRRRARACACCGSLIG
jgi:hypothetical protein